MNKQEIEKIITLFYKKHPDCFENYCKGKTWKTRWNDYDDKPFSLSTMKKAYGISYKDAKTLVGLDTMKVYSNKEVELGIINFYKKHPDCFETVLVGKWWRTKWDMYSDKPFSTSTIRKTVGYETAKKLVNLNIQKQWTEEEIKTETINFYKKHPDCFEIVGEKYDYKWDSYEDKKFCTGGPLIRVFGTINKAKEFLGLKIRKSDWTKESLIKYLNDELDKNPKCGSKKEWEKSNRDCTFGIFRKNGIDVTAIKKARGIEVCNKKLTRQELIDGAITFHKVHPDCLDTTKVDNKWVYKWTTYLDQPYPFSRLSTGKKRSGLGVNELREILGLEKRNIQYFNDESKLEQKILGHLNLYPHAMNGPVSWNNSNPPVSSNTIFRFYGDFNNAKIKYGFLLDAPIAIIKLMPLLFKFQDNNEFINITYKLLSKNCKSEAYVRGRLYQSMLDSIKNCDGNFTEKDIKWARMYYKNMVERN